jgi:transcriptional regulator with XRE-family HTH domain
MDEVVNTVAGRLRRLRDASGLTQQQLAVAAGLSVGLVSQLERGTVADPRLSTILVLAKALGVDAGELIGRVEPPAADDTTASKRKGKK